jgi:mRNA interferase MazF
MNQGEIWLVDLDPTRGAEIQKTRPAVIVNRNQLGILPLKIVVPITDWKPRYSIAPWMVKIEPTPLNGLLKSSCTDCFQVRSISQERLVKKFGAIDETTLQTIKTALKVVFDL